VELKCDQLDDRGLTVEVARLLQDRRLQDRVFVSSFNPVSLVRLAQAAPRVRRGLLLDPLRRWFPQAWLWLPVAASTSVHVHFSQLTPERAARWHAAGLEIAVWTVDELDEARRLRALAVGWLITNRPGALREELSGMPRPRPSAWR
jgi:glycerophosphoryl diester phosphodiesterase